MLVFKISPRDARPLLTSLSLALALAGALPLLLSVVSSVQAQALVDCETSEKPQVPGADAQDNYCLADLTTKALVDGVTTSKKRSNICGTSD